MAAGGPDHHRHLLGCLGHHNHGGVPSIHAGVLGEEVPLQHRVHDSVLSHGPHEFMAESDVGLDKRGSHIGLEYQPASVADPVERMPVEARPTPNPNAMKFTVGVPVGGPVTYLAGRDTGDPLAAAILSIEGVVSVFWTADFVTVSKEAGADWSSIHPAVLAILKDRFAKD